MPSATMLLSFGILLSNLLLAAISVQVGAFQVATISSSSSPDTRISRHHNGGSCLFSTQSKANEIDTVEEWTELTEDGGVQTRILSASSSSSTENITPILGGKEDVTVEYVGSLAARNWSVEDVISCWLPDQGPLLNAKLSIALFREFDIDGAKLSNPKKFNRKFLQEGLGIEEESKINNLLAAAQALSKYDKANPPGMVFDKNQFTFRVGKGMAIEAFELAVKEMKVGETVTLVARADYAYGSKGVKAALGKVVVPPYSTVSFDLTLVEIK